MSSWLRSKLEKIAQKLKGPTYHIDPYLPLTALIGIASRRVFALLRGIFKGINLNPKNLVFVSPGVILRNRRFLKLGRGVTLGSSVTIDALSRDGVTLAEGVNIGPYTIIESTGVISNLGKGCYIGANSGMGAFSFIGAAGGVYIGNDVIMGQRVSFHSENHLFDKTDVLIRKQGTTRKGITIEDNCWIGSNVTFLDGSHVGTGSIIAAGAVVRGLIPSFSIAAGVPVKIIRTRSQVDDIDA